MKGQKLVCTLFVFLVITNIAIYPGNVGAAVSNAFSSSITPATSSMGQTQDYSMTITNLQSTYVLGSAGITIPGGVRINSIKSISSPTGKYWTPRITGGLVANASSANLYWPWKGDARYDDGDYAYTTSASTSEMHIYNYGIDVSSQTITQVLIRVDAYSTLGDNLRLRVTPDKTTTWLPSTLDIDVGTYQTTYWVDVTNWTTWTPTNLANIGCGVSMVSSTSSSHALTVDWVAVYVSTIENQGSSILLTAQNTVDALANQQQISLTIDATTLTPGSKVLKTIADSSNILGVGAQLAASSQPTITVSGIDTFKPVSNVNSLPNYTTSRSTSIAYTATDNDQTGINYIELFYRVNGSSWSKFGSSFNSSPISFTSPSDGYYEFYTLATDNANNKEDIPASPDASTTIVTVDLARAYASTITPTLANTGDAQLYTLTITDRYNIYQDTLGSATISIPSGMTVNSIGTTLVSNGQVWWATLDGGITCSPTWYTTGWSSPRSALADDTSSAYDSYNNGLQQTYGGYRTSIAQYSSIAQVCIRVDAHTSGDDDIKVEVSTDGGTTWLPTNTILDVPPTIDGTYYIDVTGWTNWTPERINNIATKVTHIKMGSSVDTVAVEWIPVYVVTLETPVSTITLKAAGDSDKLSYQEQVTLSFTATAASTGLKQWTTNVNLFSILGSQPTVNVASIETTKPTSQVGTLPPNEYTPSFDIPYTASDVGGSGLRYVQLYYRVNGSQWGLYGSTIVTSSFTSSPINFTATGDGLYEFYTVATDNAMNLEDAPISPDAQTTVITKLYSATISPTAAAKGQMQNYTLTVKNDISSKSNIGYVEVTVPSELSLKKLYPPIGPTGKTWAYSGTLRSPTATSTGAYGWYSSTNAYANDNSVAYCNYGGAQQIYKGYGYNLANSEIVSQVIVQLDAYLSRYASYTFDDGIKLEISTDDGATWLSTSQTVYPTSTEKTYFVDVSSWTEWTPTKVNSIQTRVTHVVVSYTTDGVNLDWTPVYVATQPASGQPISLSALSTADNLSANEQISITFNATSTTIGTAILSTNAYQSSGNNQFTTLSAQPLVTISAGATLSVTSNQTAIIAFSGSGVYVPNTTVSISAPASQDIVAGQSRYRFVRWTGTGISNASSPTTTVVVNADQTITASYVIEYYLIVNNNGHGSVTGNGWYPADQTAVFSISPTTTTDGLTQYKFKGWSGDSTQTNASSTITMTGPKIVTAQWQTIILNPAMQTCTAIGTQKTTFTVGEEIYLSASGLSPNTIYQISIVNDATWTDGMKLPQPVISITAETDSTGNIATRHLWSPTQLGKFDIIVDVNSDGNYQLGLDAIQDNITTTAGLFVVPEYFFAGLSAMLSCFAAFFVYTKPRKPLLKK